jgi:hypothetical protein
MDKIIVQFFLCYQQQKHIILWLLQTSCSNFIDIICYNHSHVFDACFTITNATWYASVKTVRPTSNTFALLLTAPKLSQCVIKINAPHIFGYQWQQKWYSPEFVCCHWYHFWTPKNNINLESKVLARLKKSRMIWVRVNSIPPMYMSSILYRTYN